MSLHWRMLFSVCDLTALVESNSPHRSVGWIVNPEISCGIKLLHISSYFSHTVCTFYFRIYLKGFVQLMFVFTFIWFKSGLIFHTSEMFGLFSVPIFSFWISVYFHAASTQLNPSVSWLDHSCICSWAAPINSVSVTVTKTLQSCGLSTLLPPLDGR